MAHILASVAEYKTELRGERVRAGEAIDRANRKRWGGSQRGRRVKVVPQQASIVRQLKREGEPIAGIAWAVALSRPTMYSVPGEV